MPSNPSLLVRLRELLRLRAIAQRRRHRGPRPATDRARHAAARRHRPLAALLRLPLGGPRAGRVRRRSAEPVGRCRRASSPPRRPARARCSSRSSARAGWTRCRAAPCSATPATRGARRPRAARRTPHSRLRGRPPALASRRGRLPRPAHRRPTDRDPRDRLRRPEPVALHLAPLLGGRRDRPRRADRLGRAATGPPRRRGQPAAGPLARLHARAGRWPAARSPSPRSPTRPPTTSGCATSGSSR